MEFLSMSAAEFRKMIAKEKGTSAKQVKKTPEVTTNKYNAQKTDVDGRIFDSKKEAGRYLVLKNLQTAGKIAELQCQVPFELMPKFEYRGEHIRAIVYIADFYYYDPEAKEWVVEDVKSEITRRKTEYIIKKKLFMWKYPEIRFQEYL